MKHRERVRMALEHKTPDRCPLQVSFTPEFAERLRADLQLKGRGLHNPHGGGNSYELEIALDEDMLLTSVGWVNGYYAPGYRDVDSYRDEWGVTWQCIEYDTRFGKGKYTEPSGHPLAEDDAIAAYRSPDPTRPELYAEAARVVREFGDEYWIVGVVPTTIFESAWALRGYDQLMMDFVTDAERANAILDLTYNYHKVAAAKLVEGGVDMVWLGDDVGMQGRMLISPASWRQYLKPRMAELIASLKRINPAVKTAYHSDGYIYPIIRELIEIGLDVLNPIQPAAMDPARLKRDFGDRLSFWGSMDLQHTLPHGTPDQVCAEVLLRLRTIGQDGGLILGPTHNMQLDTPLENFWAMMNTITGTHYNML
ncbi:MAG: uroporphyrinogen decarboxylase family protein [Rudaea sp.]